MTIPLYKEGRRCFTFEEIKKELPSAVSYLFENPEYTIWFYIDHTGFDPYRNYAVVLGAMEVEESEKDEYPSGFRYAMKIGSQLFYAMMQEYDMDWEMPLLNEEDGTLFDCEQDFSTVEAAIDVLDWLEKEWEEMKPILKERYEKKEKEKKDKSVDES